jgi:hypothetical protein
LWFFFVVRPEALWKDPERKSVSEAVASQKTLLERIDKAMGKLDCEGYLVRRLGVVSWDDQPVIWISVDTEDPVKAYTAAVPTLTELRALLFSEDEMLQLMRRASWSDVAIVPLVRGRSLMRQAWRLPLAVLQKTNPADPLGEWNYVLYDIPSDAWSQLGLCAHELPQVDQPKEFLQAYRELLTHAEYIEEITRASELDEGNTVSRVAQDGSVRLFTAAFHTLEMLLPIIDRIAHAEESSDDVKSLLGTAAGLVKTFSEPFRCAQWLQDRVLPPLAELSEWCKALQELQGVTAQLYIAWICILYAVADVQLDA